MCVTITPRAAKFMKSMIRFNGGDANWGFRLTVKPGGCSGFDSSFTAESAALPGDTVVEQEGVILFLEEASCELLRGHTIEFRETRTDGGLAFHKPGAANVCGCGSGAGTGAAAKPASVVFMRPPAATCSRAD
jgi:iron-sulfur cluster assembly accessory protein